MTLGDGSGVTLTADVTAGVFVGFAAGNDITMFYFSSSNGSDFHISEKLNGKRAEATAGGKLIQNRHCWEEKLSIACPSGYGSVQLAI